MLFIALLLGLVEGLTEFLPISSTGHLILVSRFLGFTGKRAEVFQIFIQLGAILSVVWEYRLRIGRVVGGLAREPEARGFAAVVVLAFLPSALFGLLFHEVISNYFFTPLSVAGALVAGGVLILVVEGLPLRVTTRSAEKVSWRQAFLIGLAQCLALWPGFSRSAATIVCGLGVGLDRRSAVEFSFFLAIPTMFAATLYDLAVNYTHLEPGDLLWLSLAFVISFLVAWASIRWLLRYVSSHSFRVFAWYRLALGALVILIFEIF